MKIIQLITGSSSFGGAEAHVRDLAIGLRSRGHECIVMMGPPLGMLMEQLQANGVPVVLIPSLKKPIHPFWDTISLVQVLREVIRLKPDVIALHTSKAGMVGRLAARAVGLPSFFTPHGLSFINRRDGKVIRFRLALEYLAARFGGRLIPVCDAERSLAIEYLSLEEGKVSTIHNGLPDMAVLTKVVRSPIVITMIARFDVQKDHATLFQALSMLLHLEWELRLAGSGPLLNSARLLAEQSGLSSRIHFLEQCSDTAALLDKSDIFALITNWEAFPISILEAMRSGLPIIATDTGGVREAIHDEVSGFLVPRGDSKLIAEKLSLLLGSPVLRQSMGEESRRRFRQKFEWQGMLDKTETLYTQSLSKDNRAQLVTRIPTPLDVPSKRLTWQPKLTALAMVAVDSISLAVVVSASLAVVNVLRHSTEGMLPHAAAMGLIFVIALAVNGMYPSLGTCGALESKRLARCVSFVQIGGICLLPSFYAGRLQICTLSVWVLAIAVLPMGRTLGRKLLSRRQWWGEPVLLIGCGESMDEIVEMLKLDHKQGLHPAGVLCEGGEPTIVPGLPVFDEFEVALRFARQHKIRTAIVVLGPNQRLTAVEANNRFGAYFPKLVTLPPIPARRGPESRAKVLGGYLEIRFSQMMLMRSRRGLKRVLDILIALAACIVSLPMMLVIAVAIKLSSRGPLFYGHPRISRAQVKFKAWKFRTMVLDADTYLAERLAEDAEMREEWERDHKLRNDPRVTRIGAILRRYSLDELPQLWNVLRCEMSLVGPRPICQEEVIKYAECFSDYASVLPGLTGLWQVSGRNEMTYEERVQLDTYYVNNWTLWLDLYILFKTGRVVLGSKGAY